MATTRTGMRRVRIPLAWGAVALGVGLYAAFALSTGVAEVLYLLGVAPEAKHRAAPIVFVVHALAGSVALVVGPLQSVRWIRRRAPVRVTLGRAYVAAVWLAGIGAAVDALSFDGSPASRVLFIAIAAAWLTTTTIGMLRALERRFADQHEWMLRSYALTLFFITFSLWGPALAAMSLPPSVAYPLSQLLGAGLNLVAAEAYIRRRRASRSIMRASPARSATAAASAA